MIVRTYGRRNRGLTRSYSDYIDWDSFSLSQENSCLGLYSLSYSSQESSSLWSPSDPDPYNFHSSQNSSDLENAVITRKSKRPRNAKVERAAPQNCNSEALVPVTSTLIEAHEFGEFMEHVDEVNLALDGLKEGKPIRIRRASLLSLLSISGTAHQRRLLRARGLAKTIIDAILDLSFDDLSSNLAASTLFYVFTGDGQDENLLESSICIHFLMKLLKPVDSSASEDRTRSIGSKLLAPRKDSGILKDANTPLDSSTAAIVAKVQEILVSCKEMNSLFNERGIPRPEISPKWIALLTLEKACISKISFEDASGIVRKAGGNFKEKFRELGGLDAVFEVVRNCHSVMENWRESGSPTIQDRGDDSLLQNLVLLLKCLKIMENSTFLSTDNQGHLLGMKGHLDSYGYRVSFTKLIISVIKVLSGLYLKSLKAASDNGKLYSLSDRGVHNYDLALVTNPKDDNEIIYISSTSDGKTCSLSDSGAQNSDIALVTNRKDDNQIINISSSSNGNFCSLSDSGDDKLDNNEIIYVGSSSCCGSDSASSGKSPVMSQKSDFQLDLPASSSQTTATFLNDASQLRLRINSSTSSSCSGLSRTTNSGRRLSSNGLGTKFGFSVRTNCKKISERELLEDSLDPFAFVEDDIQPSKWDLLSGKKKSQFQSVGVTSRQLEDVCHYQQGNQDELSKAENCQQKSRNTKGQSSQMKSRSSDAEEEQSGLLADCLLTAVKVLMNLTNDNSIGCEQIAACGGLETLSYLIASHFPSFGSPSSYTNAIKEDNSCIEVDNQKNNHLTDQELDFLVAILGLLVNLVEKDGCNRSRLAATTVSLVRSDESHKDVIPLLCSVFVANQGAGDGNFIDRNDEAAMLQGEKEAEKMIVEAYAALLLAFLSTESKSIRNSIAGWLPNRSLAILVPVLERFVAFHLTLNMISPETYKAVTEVIESCRIT